MPLEVRSNMDLSSIHISTGVDQIDVDKYGMGITKSC
jgi:hypothetical protein